MRGGAYVKAVSLRDAGDVPRLEGLVEGNRVEEGRLHSAKRMVSKSEAPRVRVRGDGWRGREAARTCKVVTLETFHASRGWLKAYARKKVSCTRQSEW